MKVVLTRRQIRHPARWAASHLAVHLEAFDFESSRQREPPATTSPAGRGIRLVMSLSGILDGLTSAAAALAPQLIAGRLPTASFWILAALWLAGVVLSVGSGCAYLDAALRQGLSGGTAFPDSSWSLRVALASFRRWIVCFFFGPAILVYLAIRHSLNCTFVTALDVLIVGTLLTAAASYWLIKLIATIDDGRIGPPASERVLVVARQLNWRAILAGFAAAVAACLYAALAASALWLTAGPWPVRLVLLWLWWFSAWECAAFVLRTVGFWHFLCRTRVAHAGSHRSS
jgi:hypothetical protein